MRVRARIELVLRFLLREWRAGELRLLVAAVLLAVGTVTGISLFVDRLSGALLSESATYLAADRVIASSRPIPDEFETAARARGLATARTMTFPSMVFADERNQLVSVKAVSEGYPLRGVLRLAACAVRPGRCGDGRIAGSRRSVARLASVSGARCRSGRCHPRGRRGRCVSAAC